MIQRIAFVRPRIPFPACEKVIHRSHRADILQNDDNHGQAVGIDRVHRAYHIASQALSPSLKLWEDESMELFLGFFFMVIGTLPITSTLFRTWRMDAQAKLKGAYLIIGYLATVVAIDNIVAFQFVQLLDQFQHDSAKNLTISVLTVAPNFLLAYALVWLVALIVSFVYPSRPR